MVLSPRYDLTSNNKFQVFGEPGIGFGSVWYKPENPSEDNMVFPVDSNYSGLLIYQLGLGLVYNLSRKLGVELIIPYLRADNITNKVLDQDLYNGVGPTIGTQV